MDPRLRSNERNDQLTSLPLRHIPTSPQPFFLRRLLYEPSSLALEKWMNTIPNEGLIRYHGLFNAERLLLTTSATVNEVLQAKSNPGKQSYPTRPVFEKHYIEKAQLESFGGKGLVVVEGKEHSIQRNHTVSILAQRNIENLQPILWAKVKSLSQTLKKTACSIRRFGSTDPVHVDISKWVTRLLLDLSTLLILGHDYKCVESPLTNATLLHDYRAGFEFSSSAKLRFLLLHILPKHFVDSLPLPRNADLARTRATAISLTKPFIQSTLSTPRANPLSLLDHLSRLSTSGSYLTTQSTTILAGAHESTSSSLTAALWLLSQPQNIPIQDRLRQEILDFGHPLDSTTSPPVSRLPYLNAIILESLRLYPPFPIIGRRITTQSGTYVNGTPLPKGTVLVTSPHAMHRCTELWGNDAASFRPERWLDRPSLRGRDSFFTFGAGGRRCPAERLAKDVLGMSLFAMVGRMRFTIRSAEVSKEGSARIRIGAQGSLRLSDVMVEVEVMDEAVS
ncbi:MAG: hypothetical protein Q9227_006463 [Pyrenula ochraceoflavens]